ncbi:MAG: type II toxin-antitoxin system VapC family toxin [Polyangia bacterium]
MIHLDTHVVVWLYAGDLRRFSPAARRRLDREELRISPMVALEVQYLHEVGRISENAGVVLSDLARKLGLVQAEGEFSAVAAAAMDLGWTRDPFDRVIVAHAALYGATLLTKDRSIRRNYGRAVWD